MIPAEVLGVVLAGGDSRRMGRDKAVLPWLGTTLTENAVAVLGTVFDEVVVAGPRELARSGLEVVADVHPGLGPLAGLHAGLERAAGRPVFVLACDLPLVPPELVRHLAAAAGDGGEGAWVAADANGPQPLCGLYTASCRGEAARRLTTGEPAMHEFLELVGGVAVELTPELPFYHPELLLNLNRPEDLDRALRAAGAGAVR